MEKPRRRADGLAEAHPPALADLCVRKEKVAAIDGWLGAQLGGGGGGGRLLVVSGPAGCGKSAAVRCVARGRGALVVEWSPPAPTLWAERAALGPAAPPHESKLAAFEQFLARAGPYAPLALAPTTGGGVAVAAAGARAPRVLLLEDVPYAAPGSEQAARLREVLGSYAASGAAPAVLVLTEHVADGGSGRRGRAEGVGYVAGVTPRELARELGGRGAAEVALNAATSANVAKAVARVAALERAALSKQDAAAIAANAKGDVRAALAALELHLAGGRAKRRGVKRKAPGAAGADAAVGAADERLAHFHALGKLLYNKRRAGEAGGSATPEAGPHARPARPPPEAVAEDVLEQARLGAEAAAAFLHENFPDFVDDEFVEDLADGLAYLSDGAALLPWSGRVADGPHALAESAAGSVVARGLMFANAHPAKSQWRQLRGPAGAAVDRKAAVWRHELLRFVAAARGGDVTACGGGTEAAVEDLPLMRRIGATPLGSWVSPYLPPLRAVGADDPPCTAPDLDGVVVNRGEQGGALGAGGGALGAGGGAAGWPEDVEDASDDD